MGTKYFFRRSIRHHGCMQKLLKMQDYKTKNTIMVPTSHFTAIVPLALKLSRFQKLYH